MAQRWTTYLRYLFCSYLAFQVIFHSFLLSYSSLEGLGKDWIFYLELKGNEVELEAQKVAMEEHVRKIEAGEVMPIIDEWNLDELRIWLTTMSKSESHYLQENCAKGKISGSICTDPSQLSAKEILFLAQDEPRFKTHFQDYTALKGHNGTSKLSIKRSLGSLRKHLDLIAKEKWRIWRETVLPLLTITLYSIFTMQSLHGMIFGPSYGQLIVFGISVSVFMVHAYLIFFQTTFKVIENFSKTHPVEKQHIKDYYFDYYWSVIASEWNIWSVLMLFLHQLAILIYLIAYRKWQEAEKQRKAKEEEDFNRLFHYCQTGQKDKAKSIIQQHLPDIDINQLKNEGENALHVAVSGNHTGIVQLLIANFDDKLDANVRNTSGLDAFDIAVTKKNIDIFNLLLGLASPTITSLTLAIENDQVKMIRSLLSKIPSYKMVELIQQLEGFCTLLSKLKQKDLTKSEKSALQNDVNEQRKQLLDSLSELDDQSSLQSFNTLESQVKEEFTCPVCKELMLPPLQIFSCSNDHFICSVCLDQVIECPICRESYTQIKPTRRYKAENYFTDYISKLSELKEE